MVKQLTKNATIEEIEKSGLAPYYADHDKAVYPVSAAGVPFTAAYIQSKGDPITDLTEDMAAEQKARSTYEYLINLADDPDVIEPLKFLREREVVHFQRFGEALRRVQDYLSEKKVYTMPDMSRVQGLRYTPNTPNAQAMPYAQNTPNTPNAQAMPYAQNTPNMPNAQAMPYAQNTPNTPNAQAMPYAHNTPNIQTMPYVKESNMPTPHMPNMHNVHDVSSAPNMNKKCDNNYRR